ncbi:hypothetical protein IGI37_001813 [Enterococcus sp. AZ194]
MMNPLVRKRKIKEVPILEVVLQEKQSEALPLIIYYHGWQTSKELVLTQGRKLAEKGFRVVLPDAMGHGERKQPVSPIPSLTFWNSIHYNLFEFQSLRDFFIKKGLATDIVGVGGVSMGGMTTCALLTHHPEISAAACVMGSPAPILYRENIIKRTAEMGIDLPDDYEALLSWIEAYDLSEHKEKLDSRPLFIWHGTVDEKIRFEDTAQFVRKNKHTENGKNIEFHVAVNEPHLVKVPTMDKISSFFEAKLLS